jgi:hypothetical protein
MLIQLSNWQADWGRETNFMAECEGQINTMLQLMLICQDLYTEISGQNGKELYVGCWY